MTKTGTKSGKAPARYRVMAEYGSSGIWVLVAKGGAFRHAMIEHGALGLPAEVCRRFAAWIERYEVENLDGTLDVADYNAEGRALAVLLKAHVGPEAHVEHQGEASDGGLLPPETIG